MQSHKMQKSWRTNRTAKAVKTNAIVLFPVEEYVYSPIARKGHAGYLYLLSIHFKRKYMSTVKTEELQVPDQRVYVNELYEFVIFDTDLKVPLFDKIEGHGIIDAAQKAQAKCSPTTHLVSISLAPLKIEE